MGDEDKCDPEEDEDCEKPDDDKCDPEEDEDCEKPDEDKCDPEEDEDCEKPDDDKCDPEEDEDCEKPDEDKPDDMGCNCECSMGNDDDKEDDYEDGDKDDEDYDYGDKDDEDYGDYGDKDRVVRSWPIEGCSLNKHCFASAIKKQEGWEESSAKNLMCDAESGECVCKDGFFNNDDDAF